MPITQLLSVYQTLLNILYYLSCIAESDSDTTVTLQRDIEILPIDIKEVLAYEHLSYTENNQ